MTSALQRRLRLRCGPAQAGPNVWQISLAIQYYARWKFRQKIENIQKENMLIDKYNPPPTIIRLLILSHKDFSLLIVCHQDIQITFFTANL